MSDENRSTNDPLEVLSALRDRLLIQIPALSRGAATEIEDRGSGYHILHFRSGERAVVIEAAGPGLFYAAFLWDGRPLFADRFESVEPLAVLLRRWVSDHALPSALRQEFPELELDELADYYERGAALEGEFVRSWDAVEVFYREDGGDHFAAARAFIRALRDAGYDRLLRAGQSMSIMGLSRSRDQGLRDDQPRLWFAFNRSDMDVDANFAAGGLKGHPIELTPAVRQLLDALAGKAVVS